MFADEDEISEEEFTIPAQKQLEFVLQPPDKITCQTLLVAFYGISSVFASSLVDTKTAIARVNFQKSKQKSLACIYKNSSEQLFLIFNDEFQKMKEVHLADFIRANITFDRLIIITSIAKGVLDKDDGICLKNLSTSYAPNVQGSKFEQGLSGPQADLLQWAEIHGVSAVCYMGIYSEYQITKQTLSDTYGKVVQSLSLESNFDVDKEIKAYNMRKYSNKMYL